jgi:hypothetical protein
MAEEFQSKFVLPKKLPPYLNEFVGFMETKKILTIKQPRYFWKR